MGVVVHSLIFTNEGSSKFSEVSLGFGRMLSRICKKIGIEMYRWVSLDPLVFVVMKFGVLLILYKGVS